MVVKFDTVCLYGARLKIIEVIYDSTFDLVDLIPLTLHFDEYRIAHLVRGEEGPCAGEPVGPPASRQRQADTRRGTWWVNVLRK